MRFGVLAMIACNVAAMSGCLAVGVEADEAAEGNTVDGDETSEKPSSVVADSINGCILYKETNYGGASLYIEFPYDRNDLHRINAFGDNVSSAICDVHARVYNNANFSGYYQDLSGYHSALTYNNAISSISFRVNSGGQCTFWSNTNYSGTSLSILSGTDYNDLHRASPVMGDNISSIRCDGGFWPTVCTNDSWFGTCYTLNADNANLSGLGLNDNISSIFW